MKTIQELRNRFKESTGFDAYDRLNSYTLWLEKEVMELPETKEKPTENDGWISIEKLVNRIDQLYMDEDVHKENNRPDYANMTKAIRMELEHLVTDSKENKFEFGNWVLLDGKKEVKFVKYSKKGYATIDVKGIWLDVRINRIKNKSNN